jgi:hypothetical protein
MQRIEWYRIVRIDKGKMERRLNLNLDSNYKRTIGIALTLIDKTICELDEWARGREHRSVLYVEINRLSAAQCEAILAATANVRGILQELKDALGLEVTVQTVVGSIWGQCSGLWASLAEIESRRPRGYGAAPQGFGKFFDPKLSEIEKQLKDILGILERE